MNGCLNLTEVRIRGLGFGSGIWHDEQVKGLMAKYEQLRIQPRQRRSISTSTSVARPRRSTLTHLAIVEWWLRFYGYAKRDVAPAYWTPRRHR